MKENTEDKISRNPGEISCELSALEGLSDILATRLESLAGHMDPLLDNSPSEATAGDEDHSPRSPLAIKIKNINDSIKSSIAKIEYINDRLAL
jgi:hypothetical protein